MTELLQLPEEERTILITNASAKLGLRTQAVEKDWWVTLVLKALFSLPMHEHFIFKGGTSLSKGWKLIDRFSEDIDIALSPEAFGRSYEVTPSHSYVKRLKREGCAYTNTVIKPALEKRLTELGVPDGMFSVEPEPVPENRPDKDPQTLYVHFNSLFEQGGYMLDPVKIEFGVRALREPYSVVKVMSLFGGANESPAYNEVAFKVTAVEPRKTFMEKLMLLHEKYAQGIRPDAAERQSRHLYDLHYMTLKGIAGQVVADSELYKTLLHHRSHYVRLKDLDYNAMQLQALVFIPPDEYVEFFRNDYNTMREQMMYGDEPEFDALLEGLYELQKIINDSVIH